MNVLSLFSGVGGMDLGLEQAGHTIVGMCEIDKHARNILKRHWPDIPLHEDVTTLDGSEYRGRIDLVSGGSPCQDLSVAGQRKGLDGARSGLFWQQCRIADQAAARWVLWENVAGALSSNRGADFAAVLWGLTGTYPRVPDGGWNTCGVVVGPKRTAVWRLLDAQWFGVAQRRRRVFVVAGAGGECRPEILFESEGMFGGVAPSRTPGEEIAGTLGGGTPGGGPKTDTDRMTFIPGVVDTLLARDHKGVNSDGGETKLLAIPVAIKGRDGGTTADTDRMTFVKAKRARTDQDDETWEPNRPAPTLNQFDNGHETRATILATTTETIRRLTPIECERLMGWPDNWTATNHDGTPQADSHRYRQIGNGVVANVAQWIGQRLPRGATGR